MFINLIRKLKSTRGNSLAEFAVTTAMMATLATTAAPKFSGVGEGAKEKKTMADIDKIVKSANNFYNAKVTEEGRGRFPGQVKYDEAVGGYASDTLIVDGLADFTSYDDDEGGNWVSVFGTTTTGAEAPTEPTQTNRPEWLPEKFNSPEDLSKAYSELEKQKRRHLFMEVEPK